MNCDRSRAYVDEWALPNLPENRHSQPTEPFHISCEKSPCVRSTVHYIIITTTRYRP